MDEAAQVPEGPKTPEQIEARLKELIVYKHDVSNLSHKSFSMDDRGSFRVQLADEIIRTSAEISALRWALSEKDVPSDDIPF